MRNIWISASIENKAVEFEKNSKWTGKDLLSDKDIIYPEKRRDG